ncbi:hypothetical protein [Marinobacter alexandrii]|uniref:hypothetical protein n=1 Tax=Marinobacter alexandrii TaxID=2570351 RepID=UPI0032992282
MAIGSWDPDNQAAAAALILDEATLTNLVKLAESLPLDALGDHLSAQENERLSGVMQVNPENWGAAARSLSDSELLSLIRFLCVAENLPGWEAGERSPVIPLARELRVRGQRLDKDLLRWIRSVSDNRFLPYGPL